MAHIVPDSGDSQASPGRLEPRAATLRGMPPRPRQPRPNRRYRRLLPAAVAAAAIATSGPFVHPSPAAADAPPVRADGAPGAKAVTTGPSPRRTR
jgi:hypothetical protein